MPGTGLNWLKSQNADSSEQDNERIWGFHSVVLKSIFFWDMTTCSALSGTWRFGGTYRLHLQGRRIVQRHIAEEDTLQDNERSGPIKWLKMSSPTDPQWASK
jgi:hypothetical protein